MSADKKRLKKFKKFILGILLFISMLAVHPLWLPLPAKVLLVKDSIKKADAIIVLSGDWEFKREEKAIELYKAGYVDKIVRIFEKENRGFDVIKKLLNSDMTQEEAYKRFFELNGIPEEDVILQKGEATSTFDELKVAKEIVLQNNLRSLILVTSDYHMRRALMTSRWVFQSTGVVVYTASAYSENFHPDRWWLYEDDIKGVILEYLSIAFYVAYHFMLGK